MDSVKMKMKSSFVNQHVSDNEVFFKDGFLVGSLTTMQINSFVIKNRNYLAGRQHFGSVLFFETSDHLLKLNIEWEKTRITSFEIEAGQIWWQQE